VTNLEENNLIMSSTLSTFYLFFLSCYIIRENAIAINFLRFSRDEVPSKSLRHFAK